MDVRWNTWGESSPLCLKQQLQGLSKRLTVLCRVLILLSTFGFVNFVSDLEKYKLK